MRNRIRPDHVGVAHHGEWRHVWPEILGTAWWNEPAGSGFSVTPDELMARLSGLRRAQIGGKRAPHKPLLLLWLLGQFATTGSARATYAEVASPVSQLTRKLGPR
jgi:hypothetical protein